MMLKDYFFIGLKKLIKNVRSHLNLQMEDLAGERETSEPVFLNVYGAPESIPRNEFRQPM